MSSREGARRDLVLATVCVGVGVGTLYGGPVYRAAAATDLGWSMGDVAGAFALGYLAALPIPVLVGLVAERIGVRTVLAGGSAVTAVALVGAAATQEVWHWYAAAGAALTVGYYITFVGAGLLASAGRSRGTSLGLVLGIGYGSGLTVGPLAAQVLVDGVGWRSALLVEGLVAGLGAAAAVLRSRQPSSNVAREAPATPPIVADHGIGRGVLLVGFFLGNMLIAVYDESVYQHGYAYGAALGLSGTAAAAVLSATSATMTIGLIAGGTLSDAVGRRPILVGAGLGSAGALVGFMTSSGQALPLWGAAFGLPLGASIAVRSAAWADAFAGPSLGRNVGIVAAGYPAGAAITTYAGAAWLDSGGTFAALYGAGVLAALLWTAVGASLTSRRSPTAAPTVGRVAARATARGV